MSTAPIGAAACRLAALEALAKTAGDGYERSRRFFALLRPGLRPGIAKEGAARWRSMVRSGTLSPASEARIAETMKPGTVLPIRPIGSGAMNMAMHAFGNVSDAAGQPLRGRFVLKVPLRRTEGGLQEHYRPFVQTGTDVVSKELPGAVPRMAATPRGLVQEYADKTVPGSRPTWLESLFGWMHDRGAAGFARDRYIRGVDRRLWRRGILDLHADNVTPGGQVIDFLGWQSPHAALNNAVYKQLPRIPGVGSLGEAQTMPPEALSRLLLKAHYGGA